MSDTLAGRVAGGQATKPTKVAALKHARRKLRMLGRHWVGTAVAPVARTPASRQPSTPRYYPSRRVRLPLLLKRASRRRPTELRHNTGL